MSRPTEGESPEEVRRGRFGERASKCADEAHEAELAREQTMTPLERMQLALELDEETEELLTWLGAVKR